MHKISFIDAEIDPSKNKILDLGIVRSDGAQYRGTSIYTFKEILQDSDYVCGHNILHHDLKHLASHVGELDADRVIDTLYWSPLLFPERPYHALVKDEKLITDELNNPLNDALKAKDLFWSEVEKFKTLSPELKGIYFGLLQDKAEFKGFFRYVNEELRNTDLEGLIRAQFREKVCVHASLSLFIREYPIELAFCLALIHTNEYDSITPPWVLKNYPEVERLMFLLRNKPCLIGCVYCRQALDINLGLKRFFGFESYRKYNGEALQEKAVQAAVDSKSILAVFPTGGGKSITFQVPALMSGESERGLTVIISPLQSLMKDQVDNLEKNKITRAVTINGLLDPIERAKSIERVADGSASLLYISPESLRSKTIERLLLNRNVVRFVIDEAHCFSSWGQDFRVDYLYIAPFIKSLQQLKNRYEPIPVSCFTATAKQKVIEDIRAYFKENLSLDLEVFSTGSARPNLRYKVFQKGDPEEKYQTLRNLIEEKDCPTIVYVSRTKKATELAERLTNDGLQAGSYHGKMESAEKTKSQEAFTLGELPIMVATSAFGMGVDKKDVGLVVHYEISDSLENYVQEAGRAGRDESIVADCYVLYDEEDLSKHLVLLNQTKLSANEIQQIWKAIKDITRFRKKVSNSALEIARKAGWDDTVADIETRVKTAIAALEDAGYVQRGANSPQVFATSILTKSAQEAIDQVSKSDLFTKDDAEKATRILKKLFASKSRKNSQDEAAESRVDYISDHLGIVKADVIRIIELLREIKVLAKTDDMTAFIKSGDSVNRSRAILKAYYEIEKFLVSILSQEAKTYNLKELNELAEAHGCTSVNPSKLKTILNLWHILKSIDRRTGNYAKDQVSLRACYPKDQMEAFIERRFELARIIVDHLYEKIEPGSGDSKEVLVEFSIGELKAVYEGELFVTNRDTSANAINDALFYLSRIESIKIEGGFMVLYNKLSIERTEDNYKKQYTKEDYKNLDQFYDNKVQQIHIVGEYANKMLSDYKGALEFVDDYFQLNYPVFLRKYFPGSRANEIRQKITPKKFQQLFGTLSPPQIQIVNDKSSQHLVVLAGPGSGKTRVLVHKLASLLLMEDIKHEQLLMLTFSRAAATEFKKRLIELIGNAAYFVEMKTFHSFCFDLLGRKGNQEHANEVIGEATKRIVAGEVETGRITKLVLVIDEAQDMNADEFALVQSLMEQNEAMRVIAVGDDDQNIFEFRGARSAYLQQFITEKQAKQYELLENYRSRKNIVEFANGYLIHLKNRLKKGVIQAVNQENGRVKVVKHEHENLLEPMVADFLRYHYNGSICMMATTNQQAHQLTGLLRKNGVRAKLIQSNDSFKLFDLIELRYFYHCFRDIESQISDEKWEEAKRALKQAFDRSKNLPVYFELIAQFEKTTFKKKYKSDLENFISESKLEDFLKIDNETVFVSTIH
ncbi:MAG TPA: RecQ family ATP-dependent DNA helicase, partial [Bacteroidetes bacterium]|nr:RecQ family ATP-dependent DNA helicase [Bacteroidota bacterium]